jgi:hypothetical protein
VPLAGNGQAREINNLQGKLSRQAHFERKREFSDAVPPTIHDPPEMRSPRSGRHLARANRKSEAKSNSKHHTTAFRRPQLRETALEFAYRAALARKAVRP